MISKDMSLIDLIKAYPQARNILEKHGMACPRCMGAMEETIEKAACRHGLNVDVLLADLEHMVKSEGKNA